MVNDYLVFNAIIFSEPTMGIIILVFQSITLLTVTRGLCMKDCGKLGKIEFRGLHAETLHNNSEDIKLLMERVSELEYLLERGNVSRQLITLNVVTTTVCAVFAVLWLVWKFSEAV